MNAKSFQKKTYGFFSLVSGSDCDTESCSTYRSVSEPTSSGRSATGGNFSPIYEEIVDTASCRRGCSPIQAGRGTPRSRGPPDLTERGVGDGDLVGSGGGGGMAAATASRLTASPRAVPTSAAAAGRSYQRTLPAGGAAASPPPSSVYYYSDTLRRGSGRSAASPSLLPDTDSGISSSASRSSGHNTSSESTPLPRLSADTAFGGGTVGHNVRGSLRSRRLPFPLPLSAAAGPVVSSDEDVSGGTGGFYGGEGAGVSPRGGSGRRLGGLAARPQVPGRSSAKAVDTQVIDRNASSRKPAANL